LPAKHNQNGKVDEKNRLIAANWNTVQGLLILLGSTLVLIVFTE
jgi:hypothetical protein